MVEFTTQLSLRQEQVQLHEPKPKVIELGVTIVSSFAWRKMKSSSFKKLVVPATIVPLLATGKLDIGSSSSESSAVRLELSAVMYCLATSGLQLYQKQKGKTLWKSTRVSVKTLSCCDLAIFKQWSNILKQWNSSFSDRRPSPWVALQAAVSWTQNRSKIDFSFCSPEIFTHLMVIMRKILKFYSREEFRYWSEDDFLFRRWDVLVLFRADIDSRCIWWIWRIPYGWPRYPTVSNLGRNPFPQWRSCNEAWCTLLSWDGSPGLAKTYLPRKLFAKQDVPHEFSEKVGKVKFLVLDFGRSACNAAFNFKEDC